MTRHVINTAVLKVVAPCNLNCTYCYEYNRGDSSWRSKPKAISREIARLVGHRIAEYATRHDLEYFRVNLHGGEPTLLGAKRLDDVLTDLKASAGSVTLKIGMQTNGTLITNEVVAALQQHDVRVGVSLDGDVNANRFRIDHQGRPTWERAVNGLTLLKAVGLLSGIQTVIDLDSEPEAVLDALGQFGPKEIELGQPFGNHDNPPSANGHRYTLGVWLTRAFDHWQRSKALQDSRITILTDALYAILTERPNSDWFPALPPGYLIIATDGNYEGLDILKVVGSQGRVLDMNVRTHSIEEALEHPFIHMRSGPEQLAPECRACPIVSWCAGGYYPTRYGRGRGFDNPSLYCEDLKKLFSHLGATLAAHPQIPEAQRTAIQLRLGELVRHDNQDERGQRQLG